MIVQVGQLRRSDEYADGAVSVALQAVSWTYHVIVISAIVNEETELRAGYIAVLMTARGVGENSKDM